MKQHVLIVSIFVVFLLEGTLVKWLIPQVWQGSVAVASHFVLVLVMFVSMYTNRHLALLYGFGFGLLHDVVYYGPMLGTYAFSTSLVGYLIGLVTIRKASGIIRCLFLVAAGLIAFEAIIFGLYRIFRITRVGFEWALVHQMMPSILFNLLFAVAIYVPVRKWLESMMPPPRQEDE
ncbi:rod shape-determining protein MreD [Paenibacillus cymbidii]|uniref:rod shape-determining protein MreD n=1 Tax=Paenibacillus cymbidii TaxID=1639034 RepID=UPI0010809D8B|nr:rod shape-determining protein MreD [Paenibacillus cymbidii]